MRFILLFIMLFQLRTTIKAQEVFFIGEKQMIDTIQIPSNKLVYIIPDSIEMYFNNLIDMNNEDRSFFFLIKSTNHNDSGIIGLSMLYKTDILELNIISLLKLTNRYLLINKSLYPLIFEPDLYLFTEVQNSSQSDIFIKVKDILQLLKTQGYYKEFQYTTSIYH